MKSSGLRIAVLGPESTGKTVLARNLAHYYKGEWIKEYAREYIEDLERQYNYEDVEHIAQWLLQTFKDRKDDPRPIFFDTEMIITKIWFEVGFGKTPDKMDQWLKEMDFDAFLLCYYDLPWIPDPVRENGGAMRKILFKKYKNEIEQLGKPYAVIKGDGENRIQNAINALNEMTNHRGLSKTE